MQATWTRILNEVTRLQLLDAQVAYQPGQPNRFDRYRRGKISAVERVTGRPLIVYATACTVPKLVPPNFIMIDVSDKVGFKTVTENINTPTLDVLIHSPGGYPDAAEALVQQLRGKYSDIRFIVPSYAKSAATMLAMSGNEIVMDKDAELGPIDPQMPTANGVSPAYAIIEQFKKAQDELSGPDGPAKLPSWVPILTQFGPSLLVDCQHAIDHSKSLVTGWLKAYMFAGDADADTKAAAISDYLSEHSQFLSHGRPIKIDDLIAKGVKVSDTASTPSLAAAVTELYCCMDILFGNSPAYKVFENSAGDALVRQGGMMLPVVAPPAIPVPPQAPPPQPPQNPPTTLSP